MKGLSKVLAVIFAVVIFSGANAWAGEIITGKFVATPAFSMMPPVPPMPPVPEEQAVTIGVTVVGPTIIFPSGMPLETFSQVTVTGAPPVDLNPINDSFIGFAESLDCAVGNPVPDQFIPDATVVSFVCQGRWHSILAKAAALLEFPLTFVLAPAP
jgi:hypothetical protein